MKRILSISLVLLLVACVSSKRDKQLNEINKMLSQTDSLKNVLERNKLDSVVEFQLAANELMARIRKVYKPKKVDISFGRKVDEFKELQMMFIKEKEENKRTLSGEYGLIFSSLSEERETLNQLKTDIENGRGEKNKYEEYITFEKRKMNTIKGLLDHYLMRKTKYLPRFQKSMNEINEFLNQWEKENQ
jgi:hypothetical protein